MNYKRRRRLTLLFLWSFFILALGWGLHTAVSLPELQLKQVLILGTHYTKTQDIASFCLQKRHQNIIGLMISRSFKDTLYKQFPQIESAKFGIQWPNTLTLTIMEKKPFSIFMTVPAKLCAEDGTVLQNALQESPLTKDCIKVYGLSEKWTHHMVPEPIIGKISTITKHLQKTNIKGSLVFRHIWLTPAGNLDDLVILKDEKIPIKIGPIHDLPSKFQKLSLFLDHWKAKEPSKNIQYIDLRVPHKVIVKYG
jgi:cell division septal protein FtsQ